MSHAAKSDSLESISNVARTTTIFDFFALSSGTTIPGVTLGVAHLFAPGAGQPGGPPNPQFRSLRTGSMSPSFASPSNYGIRPYGRSIRSAPEFGSYEAFCASSAGDGVHRSRYLNEVNVRSESARLVASTKS